MSRRAAVIGALIAGLATPLAAQQTRVDSLAARYWQARLDRYPETSTRLGPPGPRDARLTDLRPAAFDAYEATLRTITRDAAMVDIASLPPRDRATLAALQGALTGDLATRVCRPELWGVDPDFGLQRALPALSTIQAQASAEERARMLVRWRTIGDELDQQVLNLRAGLAAGYTAPKGVVKAVLTQLDRLLAAPTDSSPFLPPAARPGAPGRDDRWGGQMRAEVADVILPSLRRYRAFLDDVYLPRARERPGVDRNPDGAACYRAEVHAETSLDLGADSIHAIGLAEAAALRSELEPLALRLFGAHSLDSLLDSLRNDSIASFASATGAAAALQAPGDAGLADFIRFDAGVPALRDGWALYLAGLTAEDTLHAADPERFRTLLAESAQVCGLVVDTGIHALGWTRDSAIRYVLDHTALSDDSAAAQVDYYSAHPGAGLAAGIGADAIRVLQHEAANRLGPRFNLQAFQDAIQASGAVPLAILRDNVEAWIVAKGQ